MPIVGPRLMGVSTSLDTNGKMVTASGRAPAIAFVQRDDLPRSSDRLHPAVSQKRQHRRIADIDMRERTLALGRPRDDNPRFWHPIAAVKHRIALDRRRPGIILDQFGHRKDRKSTRLNSSHYCEPRMTSST